MNPLTIAAACLGLALFAAALDALLPRQRRSWWRALPKADFAPRERRAAPLQTVAPTVTLQAVQTQDRRQAPLPFVGKDRRKAAQAAARRARVANDR
ncbi:MAG: hypothetical protein L6Q75_05075 [Burkholderiaceae bacterium]|nr:hypothetical protein [Burkholderiaceae bacterium]